MENNIIHVAADTNVIVFLSVLHNQCQGVLKVLKENGYDSSKVKDVITNDKILSKYFLYSNSKAGSYSVSLTYTAKLYHALEKGEVNLYVLPTVAGELQLTNPKNYHAHKYVSFFENFENIKVLTIPDELKDQFFTDSMKLAKIYVSQRYMSDIYSAVSQSFVPSNDAFIAAEASLFGLTLLTFNDKHFIHLEKRDYKKTNGIRMTNVANNLNVFESNKDKKLVAHPMSVVFFIDGLPKEGTDEAFLMYTYPNIDETTGLLVPATIS